MGCVHPSGPVSLEYGPDGARFPLQDRLFLMTTRLGERARAMIAQAWPDLLIAVADGGNIGTACECAGIRRENIYAYRLENPAADREWQLAREQSADAFAEKVVEISENPIGDAQVARVRIDAYRWLAAKRNPRIYNDKSTVDLNVRTVDLTRIIGDANARLAAARVIECQVIPAVLPVPAIDDLL